MKKFKILISIIITLCMLWSVSAVCFAAPSAEDMYYGLTVMEKMDKADKLSDAYNAILAGLNAGKTEINMEGLKVSWEDCTLAYKLVLHDHPEIFWVTGASTGSVSDYVVTFSPTYSMTGSSITNAKSKLDLVVSSLTSGLSGKSDYEKSLILHDRLIDRTEYKFGNNHQTSYGALVEKEAVCAGYARAYQLLLHKVGIPAWYVTGESLNPATGRREAHAWNIVKLDGEWYYTDATWDDQGDVLHYAYLNLTKAQMDENHTFGEFSQHLPAATATKNNYFVKNDLVYSSFDLAKITAAFKKDKTIRVFVNGDIDKFRNDFGKNVLNIAKELGAKAGSTCSTRTISIGRELILTLNIVSPDHIHSLTLVKRAEPSCQARGNIAYYVCDCGHWFSDSDGKNEIVDHESVVLDVTDHKPSAWKSDAAHHFKTCTVCNGTINGSSANHSDSDGDLKCDVCSTELPSPESGIVVGGDPATNPSDTPSESDASSEIAPTEETSSESKGENIATPIFNNTPLIVIIAVGATVVLVAVVIIIVSVKKK